MTADPSTTLVSALAALPRGEDRGFRFIGRDRQERYYPYEALEAEAYRRARHLVAMGLGKGDRLALVIPEPHEFVLTFFAASVAGIVPVPIFPRASFKNVEGYVETLAHILETARSRVVLCMDGNREVVELVRERVAGLERIVTVEHAFESEAPDFARPTLTPDDLCFLQFTSGSTSKPKGVMVTHRNLVANARAFLGPAGLDRNDQDVGVSWLPLFHDMGLIGFILGTVVCDIPVVILPTESFARSPGLWLETITKYRGTITYAPNFAYQLVTKRVKDKDLASLDLSSLRVAGCGAEPIRAQTLHDFAVKFAPAGFQATALLPSYGMAESTLAITFHPRGTPMLVDRVDADAMREGRATPAGAGTKTVLEIVGCGRPFPGHELAVVDEDGKPLGERRVGQVVTKGPSVTAGYFENEEATRECFKEGWLYTGDLGYLAEGELFICGRVKDLIIIRGANHYPQDIEWVVGDIEGVRRGNVVAFSVMKDGTEELVIAAECGSQDAPALREAIPAKVVEEFALTPSHVALVPVGALPKTSSGKAQRRRSKAMFESGELAEHP
ncbi:MAG: AMP-binding protein [Polyangiales bacterium]